MSQNVRIYHGNCYETDSPVPMEMVKVYRALVEKFGIEHENVRRTYKSFCNFFRAEIGINNVLGFMSNDDETKVGIVTFDVEATADNYYDVHYDKEKQAWYIEA